MSENEIEKRRRFVDWLEQSGEINEVDYTRNGFKTIVVTPAFSTSMKFIITLCNKAFRKGYYPEAETPSTITLTYVGHGSNAGAD